MRKSSRPSAPSILARLTPEQLFDAIAIMVDGRKAWDLDLAMDFTFTNLGVTHRLTLRNGVLIHRKRTDGAADADTTVTLTKPRLLALLGGDTTSVGLDITGDASALPTFLGALDTPDANFNIVTP